MEWHSNREVETMKLPPNWISLFLACVLLAFALPVASDPGLPKTTHTTSDKFNRSDKSAIDQTIPPVSNDASEDFPKKHFQIPVNERGLKPLAKTFTVTGEVVDAWCYASQVMGAGRGEAHKPCGLACAHGGVTIGIVDDTGKLYIAAKSKGFTGCKDLLTPFMAKRVTIIGWLATKGGSNILKVQKVELAK
jgi:hypothetical protein